MDLASSSFTNAKPMKIKTFFSLAILVVIASIGAVAAFGQTPRLLKRTTFKTDKFDFCASAARSRSSVLLLGRSGSRARKKPRSRYRPRSRFKLRRKPTLKLFPRSAALYLKKVLAVPALSVSAPTTKRAWVRRPRSFRRNCMDFR